MTTRPAELAVIGLQTASREEVLWVGLCLVTVWLFWRLLRIAIDDGRFVRSFPDLTDMDIVMSRAAVRREALRLAQQGCALLAGTVALFLPPAVLRAPPSHWSAAIIVALFLSQACQLANAYCDLFDRRQAIDKRFRVRRWRDGWRPFVVVLLGDGG